MEKEQEKSLKTLYTQKNQLQNNRPTLHNRIQEVGDKLTLS